MAAHAEDLEIGPYAEPPILAPGLDSRAQAANGEGRCPVVPLVFKTSLGAVRFPEGSTPSLLRQILDTQRVLTRR